MRTSSIAPLSALASLALLFACGGDRTSSDGGGVSLSGAELGGETNGNETADGNNDNNGDGDGDTNGDGDGDTNGDGDADPDDDDGGSNTKWDVKSVPDGSFACGGPGDGPDFSYIWIANSSQGTMTKLNTETMVEEGRYYVRPDLGGSPSRTTVSLSGNVAIAARSGGGGVTKVFADIEDCIESNGMPGIQTSTGANDILAWNTEECRAWHQPFEGKNYYSNRPMAWAPGEMNMGTCEYDDEKLWTSASNGQTEVLLLDGATGDIEETVNIVSVGSGYLYGGAVDGEGNFWGLQNSQRIIRVDRNDFTVQDWTLPGGPGYGIAVDSQNRIWTCGGGHASRFDPETEQWQSTPGAASGIGGCMTDGEGTLYHSRYNSGVIIAIDTETVMPYKEFVIPSYVHGISIDFSGRVWGVTFASSNAYRLDVDSEVVDTYGGLIGAYTYSDMTGFGLSSVSGGAAN